MSPPDPSVLSHQELPIVCEDDVILVRRAVRILAQAKGWNAFATAAVTTAASELARNVWTHARRGVATIEYVERNGRSGLRMEFRDQGPGIEDIDRVLVGGYSTANSLGLGLAGSRRLVDEFEIDSGPGRGTIVKATKWVRFS
jgi:serine/threonine-protein kinase RsbT